MILFSVLICLANAYFVARYARDKFALTLAASFVLTAFASAAYSVLAFNVPNMLSSGIFWVIVLVLALLIFLLSNPLRHFIAWMFFLLLLIIGVILPFEIKIDTNTSVICTILAAVPVVIFRKEIKWMLVGMMSGGNLAMAILILLFYFSPVSAYESLFKLSTVLYLAGVGFGIYFQFKLYDTYFSGKKVFSTVPSSGAAPSAENVPENPLTQPGASAPIRDEVAVPPVTPVRIPEPVSVQKTENISSSMQENNKQSPSIQPSSSIPHNQSKIVRGVLFGLFVLLLPGTILLTANGLSSYSGELDVIFAFSSALFLLVPLAIGVFVKDWKEMRLTPFLILGVLIAGVGVGNRVYEWIEYGPFLDLSRPTLIDWRSFHQILATCSIAILFVGASIGLYLRLFKDQPFHNSKALNITGISFIALNALLPVFATIEYRSSWHPISEQEKNDLLKPLVDLSEKEWVLTDKGSEMGPISTRIDFDKPRITAMNEFGSVVAQLKLTATPLDGGPSSSHELVLRGKPGAYDKTLQDITDDGGSLKISFKDRSISDELSVNTNGPQRYMMSNQTYEDWISSYIPVEAFIEVAPEATAVDYLAEPSPGSATVSAERTFFYRTPDINSDRNSYCIRGDVVEVLSVSGDFCFCKYSNVKTTTGWLLTKDLDFTR